MKVIILAAGYATRLYPLTENTPKALLKIKGTTILDYIIKKIEKINVIDDIYIVTNNKFYQDFEKWKNTYDGHKKIFILNDYTNTNEDRLGAIGDLNYVIDKKKIDDDLLVLVSDNYFSFELLDFYEYFVKKNSDCVLGCEFSDLEYLGKNFAVAKLNDDDKVLELVEKPIIANSNIGVYATYLYKRETLPLIKKYLDEGNSKDAPGNFPSWLHKFKPVYCYKFKGTCYDIGTIEVYNKLNED